MLGTIGNFMLGIFGNNLLSSRIIGNFMLGKSVQKLIIKGKKRELYAWKMPKFILVVTNCVTISIKLLF